MSTKKPSDNSRKKTVRNKPKAKAKNHERSRRKTVSKNRFGGAFGKNFPSVIA